MGDPKNGAKLKASKWLKNGQKLFFDNLRENVYFPENAGNNIRKNRV